LRTSNNGEDGVEIQTNLLVKEFENPIEDIVSTTYPNLLAKYVDVDYFKELY